MPGSVEIGGQQRDQEQGQPQASQGPKWRQQGQTTEDFQHTRQADEQTRVRQAREHHVDEIRVQRREVRSAGEDEHHGEPQPGGLLPSVQARRKQAERSAQ